MSTFSKVPALPVRQPESHKATCGRVLVVAGAPEMPGAAVLTARAALRAGAGLVTVAIPETLSSTLGACVPEATQLLLPGPDAPGGHTQTRKRLLGRLASGADAVAIGPGLGTGESARESVDLVLSECDLPRVIDADGLNIVAQKAAAKNQAADLKSESVLRRPERCIWTPHPGEFERLTGEKPRDREARIEATARCAAKLGGVVLLKGHGTVVAAGNRIYVNGTGNPGMATGGAGDVLTGILAGLLGQGMELYEAAVLGVYLHGLAGDLAADALGEHSLIAGDIIDYLPRAFLEHASKTSIGDP
jgi:NAD(P)H-hydrate epimerase